MTKSVQSAIIAAGVQAGIINSSAPLKFPNIAADVVEAVKELNKGNIPSLDDAITMADILQFPEVTNSGCIQLAKCSFVPHCHLMR